MKEVTILEAEYNELKACRQMLSVISVYIEHLCDEDDTTLIGVLKLLAEYHSLKSKDLQETINKLKEDADI